MARERRQRIRLAVGGGARFFDFRTVVLPPLKLERLIPGAVGTPNRVGDLSAGDVRRASDLFPSGRAALETGSPSFRWVTLEPENSDEELELLCIAVLPKDLGKELKWRTLELKIPESAADRMCFFVVFARTKP